MNQIYSRFMSFDYGAKRIGLATGSLLSGNAEPLQTISNQHNKPDWASLDKIIEQWRPDAFIIGLPINMQGEETPSSKAARQFAQSLHKRYDLPIIMVDERLTSSEADYLMREQNATKTRNASSLRKKQVKSRDSIAAQLILQTYLQDPDQFA